MMRPAAITSARRRPRWVAWASVALAVALTGCEAIPAAGELVNAQVLDLPRSRAGLEGGFTSLHAALAAGVVRADAERGRLWRAQCVEIDAGASDGLRSRSSTLLLPEGVAPKVGALVEIDSLQAAHAGDRRRHGRFVALRAEPPGAASPDPAAWRKVFGTPRPLCRPDGVPEGRWRVQLAGAVAAWEMDFAVAERARHGSVSDAELAAGRIAVVACQLKVVDGADWTRPSWIARVPEGVALRPGDVVRLRTGAEEAGRATGPLAEVVAPAGGLVRPAAPGVVRCH